MKFLMLACRDGSIEMTAEERRHIGSEAEAWAEEIEKQGLRLQGGVLAQVDATTVVSVRSGNILIERAPREVIAAPASGLPSS